MKDGLDRTGKKIDKKKRQKLHALKRATRCTSWICFISMCFGSLAYGLCPLRPVKDWDWLFSMSCTHSYSKIKNNEVL